MFDRKTKKIYLVGIKGTGMSSLAVLLKKLGYRVSGSDTPEKFFTESQLKKNSIPYSEGFAPLNISRAKPDLVITSTAYNDRNPEIAQAKMLKLPTISYPQAIGEISKTLISAAVCGSHGKTTTTSMLGFIMQANGRTATLTGTVADSLNIALKEPKYFVFEADEYQNKLALYSPKNVILTNIDYDHPDYFKDEKQYARVFADFATRILKKRGFILYNHDDADNRRVLKKLKGKLESYGFAKGSDYRLTNPSRELNSFTLEHKYKKLLDIKLSVYGKHNMLNAAGAAVMALRLGIKPEIVQVHLKAFAGVKRRMELIPNPRYIVIDDYGHHPTEIMATLSALRAKYRKKKIFTVFHPHTFTRTKALLKEFGRSFGDSDLTLVLDIYPSAREITGGIHSNDLVKEISAQGGPASGGKKHKVIYTPTIVDAATYIKKHARKGDVILTIGAGDVWKIHKLLK